MSSRTRYLLWLIGLAVFDVVVPFPLMATVLIYVLFRRPLWFREIVSEIYGEEG
ncbi:MAG: hypothetical protein JRH07_04875 [Deltaproteobacteria bacterium]|nr:hypothetical protein [Deltaproteobacteria bacterium]MBW2121163.1 hypothetical protein [Deltaproteobacteria bacterium]